MADQVHYCCPPLPASHKRLLTEALEAFFVHRHISVLELPGLKGPNMA